MDKAYSKTIVNLFIAVINFLAIIIFVLFDLLDYDAGGWIIAIFVNLFNGIVLVYAIRQKSAPEKIRGGNVSLVITCEVLFLFIFRLFADDEFTFSLYLFFFAFNTFFVGIGAICGSLMTKDKTNVSPQNKPSSEEEAERQRIIDHYKSKFLKDHSIEEWNELFAEVMKKLPAETARIERERRQEEERLEEDWKKATPTGDYFSASSLEEGVTCNQPYSICKYCIHKLERGEHRCVLYNGKVWRND